MQQLQEVRDLKILVTVQKIKSVKLNESSFINRETLNFIFSVSTAQLKIINFNFLSVNFLLKNLLDNCNIYSNLLKVHTCPKCEEGWELHGGKCYYFSTNKSSWYQSRDDSQKSLTQSISSTLPVQSFLVRRLREKLNDDHDRFWIGLTDSKEEGKWLWVDDSPLNTRFDYNPKQPNNWPGINGEFLPEGEDCVLMEKKKGAAELKSWFDRSCKMSYKSICEKSAETGRVTCV
uniref:C-type lectin domain-containing protein n=1 Tax=Anabas testudineus TaxID=64144 RepID=A0A3Q1H6R6_ANATE